MVPMEMKLLSSMDRSCSEHDFEEASRLKEPSEFESDLEWIVYQAKVFYEGFRDLGAATNTLEEGLQKYPSSSDIHFCLAECYSRKPDTLEKAISYCTKGLAIEPKSDYAYTIKARSEHGLGKMIPAYFSAMEALKINKYNFEAGVYLGVIGFAMALAEGNIEEMKYSVENMKITLSMNPDSTWFAGILKENETVLEQYAKGGA